MLDNDFNSTAGTQEDYEMTIALTTLKHLGVGLYSNVPAVLSEVVANSYDADADTVSITIDKTAGEVIVKDDGWGMTKEDLNEKFLNVGYTKREYEPTMTPKGRHVMGRKGIGKLALFSIANTVELHSVKVDSEGQIHKNGFVMKADDIETAIKRGQKYHPKPLDAANIVITKGTRIILRDLKSSLNVTEVFLRRRLARRFSVIGAEHGFTVSVNDEPVGVQDRDYFNKIEYLWCVGLGSEKYKQEAKSAANIMDIDGDVDIAKGYRVTGWVGTIDEQKNIEEGNNTIVVLAWGKLIHEDLLKDMKESGVYANYLIGEIRADFLDDDAEDDIATSDRQSLKETDPRFGLLKEFVRSKILKTIQSRWTDLRNNDAEKKATQNPKVKEWFDSLQHDNKKYARSLFGKIESFPVKDADYKRQLYKHGILAFQTLALRENLSVLENINTEDELNLFAQIFASIDELEAVHYHEIVKGRLEVLKTFENIVPTAKERVVQMHIFNHLWLLDPSWERASTDARIEQAVTTEFNNISAKLTDDEKDGRIDIRYKTAAGENIIIELKKGDRKVKATELSDQILKYKNALTKCLLTAYPDKPVNIKIICLVGLIPEPSDDLNYVSKTLDAVGARFITYDNLIQQTRDSYRQYLEANEKIGKIQELIDSI